MNRIRLELTTVLVVVGGTADLAYLALSGLSRGEERWVSVKGSLKLSLVLIIGGAASLSAGSLENLLIPASLAVDSLRIVGIAVFMLGMIVEGFSFVRARASSAPKS